MILVADSGSTKCDWALLRSEAIELTSTQGFNPRFHDREFIVKELKKSARLIEHAHDVTSLYYYGAGCRSSASKNHIKNALNKVFCNAEISVDHDLTASIRATCGNEPGIGCILGTGSNLGYFDGKELHTKESGLGFILGDEGSGTFFGKQLLADFLLGHLPESVHNDLIQTHGLNRESIMTAVYMRPHVNVYLSQFMPVLGRHKDLAYVRSLLIGGFKHFFDVNVKRFDASNKVPIHFVGSVAYHFKDLLEIACKQEGLTLGKVIKKPIENLVDYHKSTL